MVYKTKEMTKQYNKMYYEELKMLYPEKYEEHKRKAREASKKQYEKKLLAQGKTDKPKREYKKRELKAPPPIPIPIEDTTTEEKITESETKNEIVGNNAQQILESPQCQVQ